LENLAELDLHLLYVSFLETRLESLAKCLLQNLDNLENLVHMAENLVHMVANRVANRVANLVQKLYTIIEGFEFARDVTRDVTRDVV
jgi:hypothetical protein